MTCEPCLPQRGTIYSTNSKFTRRAVTCVVRTPLWHDATCLRTDRVWPIRAVWPPRRGTPDKSPTPRACRSDRRNVSRRYLDCQPQWKMAQPSAATQGFDDFVNHRPMRTTLEGCCPMADRCD